MKNNPNISPDDERIRRMMHSLPEAPENQWFTPRVMNRLPERRRNALPRIAQILCYALAVGAVVIFAVLICYNIALNGLTFSLLGMLLLIPVLGALCAGVIVVPAVRRLIDGDP